MLQRRATVGGLLIVIAVVIITLFSRSTPDRIPSSGPHTVVSTSRGSGPKRPCRGTEISKGANLVSVVNSAPAGTTFCIAPGVYIVSAPILPKSNDRFIGTAPNRDGVTIKTTSAQVIFNADQTIGTSFRHFAITGAVNACPGFNCGATGRAISRGAELTLTDMHLYGNGQNGIGAAGEGLIVTRSEIDHNGAKVSDGVSAGIKSIHSMTVTDSYIHDNVNNGIWCDIQCGRFVVSHNTVVRNTGSGIFMEISQGPAIIERNTVKGNNQAHSPTAGGINITDSKNAIVRNNLVSNNFGFDIAAHVDPRINCGSPSPACGFLLSHVKILGNSIGQNPIQGCDTTAVECAHNR